MDIKSRSIVQSNMLLEASYKINIDEYRLINLALSKIDSKGQQPDEPYEITPDDFCDAYGLNRRNVNVKLKEAASGLLRKPITLYFERDGKLFKNERPWFSIIEYCMDENERKVKIEFSK